VTHARAPWIPALLCALAACGSASLPPDPGDDHPVACVSWDEARACAAWLAARTGAGYRLLTEAEWANGFDRTTMSRYAGMDTSAYPHFDPMECSDGRVNTSPVGSLAVSTFDR
jgi:formylglycine-generating enzyme required for sulfatase activity